LAKGYDNVSSEVKEGSNIVMRRIEELRLLGFHQNMRTIPC